MAKPLVSIPRRDMNCLQEYGWPGNVREPRNVAERAMILSSGPVLRIAAPAAQVPIGGAAEHDDMGMTLDEAQRRRIARVLETTGGRIGGPGGAAEMLGVKPTTLRSRMKRQQMDPRQNGRS